jgi:hypothetical protein
MAMNTALWFWQVDRWSVMMAKHSTMVWQGRLYLNHAFWG